MRRTGTYSLGGPPVTTGLGTGPGLATQGADQQAMATQMLGRVAEDETRRNIENRRREQERKAGNAQLGATAGAMYGSTFGPWGSLVGGLIGGISGGAF